MKIGIVTQPLLANYGGFLQAWALQEKLRKMGHEPQTVDYLHAAMKWYRFPLSWAKTIVHRCLGKKRAFAKKQPRAERKEMFDSFVRKHMNLTSRVESYNPELVSKYGFDAVITGSDQVWRPCYNKYLEDMYLRFVQKAGVKKIAYAVSFGVDTWEYTPKQTKKCRRWARQLDAVSVREESGVLLCQHQLGVDAIEVLDPTLLHTAADYKKLCSEVPQAKGPYLASYVLDLTPEKQGFIEQVAKEHGLVARIFSADKDAALTIEEWLAIYRDARYVVTDSFHGTVFSILFQKPFLSIVNESRGASRFHSLLGKFGLESRLVNGVTQQIPQDDIDWEKVNALLEKQRAKATDFLNKALN